MGGLCGSKNQPKKTAEGDGQKTLLASEATEAKKEEKALEPQTQTVAEQVKETVEDVKEKLEEVAEKVTEKVKEVKDAVLGTGEEVPVVAEASPVKENVILDTTEQKPAEAVIEQTSAPKAALCCGFAPSA